jgi:hypothetical protein
MSQQRPTALVLLGKGKVPLAQQRLTDTMKSSLIVLCITKKATLEQSVRCMHSLQQFNPARTTAMWGPRSST